MVEVAGGEPEVQEVQETEQKEQEVKEKKMKEVGGKEEEEKLLFSSYALQAGKKEGRGTTGNIWPLFTEPIKADFN